MPAVSGELCFPSSSAGGMLVPAKAALSARLPAPSPVPPGADPFWKPPCSDIWASWALGMPWSRLQREKLNHGEMSGREPRAEPASLCHPHPHPGTVLPLWGCTKEFWGARPSSRVRAVSIPPTPCAAERMSGAGKTNLFFCSVLKTFWKVSCPSELQHGCFIKTSQAQA